MTNTSAILNPHFSSAHRQTGLSHWALKFSNADSDLKSIARVPNPMVKEMALYPEGRNPGHTAFENHEKLLAGYRTFVQTAVKNPWMDGAFQEAAAGETLTAKAWQALVGEVVTEAGRIVEAHGQNLTGKLELLEDLKRVAETGLFN